MSESWEADLGSWGVGESGIQGCGISGSWEAESGSQKAELGSRKAKTESWGVGDLESWEAESGSRGVRESGSRVGELGSR